MYSSLPHLVYSGHPVNNSSPSPSWLWPGGQWGNLSMAKFQPFHLPALTVGEWHAAPVHNLTKTVMPPVPSNLALGNNCGERKSVANLAKCWQVAFQGDQVKTPLFSLLAKFHHHLPHATPLSRDYTEIIKGFIYLCLTKWLWGTNEFIAFYRIETSSHSSANSLIKVVKASKIPWTQLPQQNTCLDTTLPYMAEDSGFDRT